MTKYRMSEQNLLVVMNHLPSYGLDVIQVLSGLIEGKVYYTMELSGNIPMEEIAHFNNDFEYLEEIQ